MNVHIWILICNILLSTVKVSPSIGDVAKARFVQGTKLLAEGGPERLFHHTFGVVPGEKYLHSYACYLATPTGPVNGTLYISTKRLAFCSESPLYYSSSPPGQSEWLYYKVCLTLYYWGCCGSITGGFDISEIEVFLKYLLSFSSFSIVLSGILYSFPVL